MSIIEPQIQVLESDILLKLMHSLEELARMNENEFKYLIKRDQWLECLEAAGVDNWDGMEAAVEMWNDYYPNEALV